MVEPYSPLRYPGGKATLAGLLAALIKANGAQDGTYVEPYAGGAGAALSLLMGEHVSHIVINDIDERIHAFWWSVLNRSTQFLDMVATARITMDEWYAQREIYLRPRAHGRLRIGFATFFLNRCNRSGILVNGGPVGGHDQAGKWKLNARFDPTKLAKRIESIAHFRDRITVSCVDAMELLQKMVAQEAGRGTFVYLDPPYYVKGSLLYLNAYTHENHLALANFLRRDLPFAWLTSYDNAPEIREMYAGFHQRPLTLSYTTHRRRAGRELLIYGDKLVTRGACWPN